MALENLRVQITADTTRFQRGMDKAVVTTERAGTKISKVASKIGKSLQIAFAAATAAAIYDAGRRIAEFDQATANLAAVTGKTRDEIKALTDDAKRLGGTSAFTATQVAELQTEFAKLGFTEQQILGLTEATTQLAAASGTELAEAASVVGNNIQAFGLRASDTQKVVDTMAKSFTSSALDMTKFTVSMRQVAPIAKNAGLSFEQTTAALGVLANNGIRAETAGTGLRNILLKSNEAGMTLRQSMELLAQSTDKSAAATEMFGLENTAVALTLAESMEKIDGLTKTLDNAAGTAQEMADKQLNTLRGSITMLTSAWEGFVLSIEDGSGIIGKSLKSVVDALTSTVQGITRFNEVSAKSSDSGFDLFLARLLPAAKEADRAIRAFGGSAEEMIKKGHLRNAAEDVAYLTEKLEEEQSEFIKNDYAIAAYTAAITDLNKKIEARKKSQLDYFSNLKTEKKLTEETTEALNKQAKAVQLLSLQVETGNQTNVKSSVNANKKITDSLDAQLQASTKMMQESQIVLEESVMRPIREKAAMTAAVTTAAFQGLGNVIVQSLGQAETAGGRFLRALIQNTTSVIAAATGQAVANAIVGGSQAGAATGPAAPFTTPAFIAQTVGSVLAAFAAIPKFADGGVVSGPTLGLMGEYTGARNNPEVIAPLNKLQGMLDNSSGSVRVFGTIQGSDILLSSERAQFQRRRYTGR